MVLFDLRERQTDRETAVWTSSKPCYITACWFLFLTREVTRLIPFLCNGITEEKSSAAAACASVTVQFESQAAAAPPPLSLPPVCLSLSAQTHPQTRQLNKIHVLTSSHTPASLRWKQTDNTKQTSQRWRAVTRPHLSLRSSGLDITPHDDSKLALIRIHLAASRHLTGEP